MQLVLRRQRKQALLPPRQHPRRRRGFLLLLMRRPHKQVLLPQRQHPRRRQGFLLLLVLLLPQATMPSITTIASSATTQASKENAEEALVVSPSPVEHSNSTFSEIIIGIGIVALCLILGYCGFRAIKAKSNNSAQTPLYMQDKNINSWRMRTKKNALAVAYMEQIDSGTSKGDREIQMTI